jgi:hypothetical protein
MYVKWLLLWLLLLVPGALAVTNFEFVVIGDTRPRFGSENFRVFEDIIPKINAARPAFVINLGDLIYGYGPLRKEKQWDQYEQAVRLFDVPYHQLPGNHDVHSGEAARIYAHRFGRFYDSFDWGDCHFVLLDNCENSRWGYIGPDQLAWLKGDLKSTTAGAVFVFMHFPVWEPEIVSPASYLFWRDTLQPLFRQSRVRAVFGGHTHCYGPTREFDGIRYFITGGGGAELRPDYRKAGGEHHFMKVRLSGNALEVRIVTDRGELSDVDADLMGGLLFAERNSTRIGITQGSQDPRTGVAFEVALRNPDPVPLTGTAVWNFDASHFEVTPRETPLRVVPGQTARLHFALKTLRLPVALDELPWLTFDVDAGGVRHRFQREILFLQSLTVPFGRKPSTFAGWTSDGSGVPGLPPEGADRSGAGIQATHDSTNLYLKIDVPAKDGALGGDSAYPDDLQIGFSGRSGDTGFGAEAPRLGFRSTGVAVEVSDRTPGHAPGGMVPEVKASCGHETNRMFFEITIPKRRLPRSDAPGGQRRLVAGISFQVPGEDESRTPAPVEPSPNSFAYQVRYGANSLVPVRFIELVLAPDKP